MFLITEKSERVFETKQGKDFFIEGIFLQSDIVNGNRRLYPEKIMDKEVQSYIKNVVNEKRAFGEIDHPTNNTINIERISHLITELVKDGKNWIGKAKILETESGKIIRAIIEGGGKVGVSSRGLGTVATNKDGISEVQSDFRLITAADVVINPSAPDAFVNGILESKEFIFVDGRFMERDIKEAKTHIHNNDIEKITMSYIKFINSLK